VKLLLDTHAFIFAISAPESLGLKTKRLLQKSSIERWVSVVSLWEIAIKVQIGKLDLPRNGDFYAGHLAALQARTLSVHSNHTLGLLALPLHHGDPFDRLLIAQAKEEGLTFVTRDKAVPAYGIETIW